MVNYKYADLFAEDSISKHLTIEYDTTVITNDDLFNQEYTLEESLCSEPELRFGACEASVIKFKVANIVSPMINKQIAVKMYLEGHNDDALAIGKYKVAEDKLTADRKWRNVVVYDALYDIINADAADVAAWYNSVLPNKDSTMTMKQFRASFINHFGLEQKDVELVNDNMTVERTIEPSELSGLVVITCICEINGCFGHIGRDGKFHYIYLPQAIQGLHPSNDLFPDHAPDYLPYQQRTGHLYPQDSKSIRIGANGTYIGQPQYESFLCQSIDKLQIRQEENDIGVIVGKDEGNCYIIEDNFLVYGKGSEELQQIASNILSKITNVIYRPFNAEVKGNPCLEVGDPVRLTTKYELIESYILKRTLKGTQALRDTYSANGVKTYVEQVNGVHKSIIQLKGKSNVLERTIEETRLEMTDIEAGLKNEISITAKGLQANITAEKERAEGEEEKLSNKITITAEGLTADITAERERATGEEEKLSTSIKVTAEGLQANITKEQERAEGEETKLSSSIKITSEGLSAEISRAENAEKGLQQDYTAKITATAKELSSEITEKTQTWNTGEYTISHRGNGFPTISVDPGKFYLNEATGEIYKGVGAVQGYHYWVDIASYDWSEENFRYELSRDDSAIYEYSVPQYINYDLDGYDWGENRPDDNYGSPGDEFLEVTVKSVVDFWLCIGEETQNAYWTKVGQATIQTLPEMASQINQTSNEIKLTVKKGNVSSEISQEAGQVKITAGRFVVESNYLDINKGGTSGEIVSKNGSGRYIKLNTGGLEAGYDNTLKCSIVCHDKGLDFRGQELTFCMSKIRVGTSMNATKTNIAYTGDIAYVAPINGSVDKLSAAVLHVWNGLVLDNSSYEA